ncbi:MAG TPA: PAS domain-containing sensor histidine kinase [Candidatus Nanoarchaeia archaeon]|nr:PAS domain-containing sensor histidine kinase [Candidatus Nanoarchaeia archaeon]
MSIFNLKKESENRLSRFFEVDFKKKAKETEEKFKTVFESSSDGIIFINNSGQVIEANKAITSLSGYNKEFFIGKNIGELNDVVNLKKLDSIKKKGSDFKLITRNGKKLDVEINLFAMKHDNKTIGRAIIVSDVSYKKKIEELKLNHAREVAVNKLRDRLFMRVSHELRQPLMPIIGYASSLAEGKISEGDKMVVNKILSNANRLNNLINKVIDINYLESKDSKLNFIKTNLSEIARELVDEFKNSSEHVKIKLVTKGVIVLNIDSVRVKRALSYLIENAFENTTKGLITLGLSGNNKRAVITIKDTGKGMTKEQLVNINKTFNDLYREEFYEHLYEGFGLGMIIAQLITKKHHGSFDIKSVLGKGSTITITIPSN